MLELHSVSKSYGRLAGRVWIARQVNLALAEGRILGLVGPSGAGKTTLGRMVLGLERPDQGQVTLDGENIWRLRGDRWRRFRAQVQMVPQHPDAAFDPRCTIAASLAEVFRFHRVCARGEQASYLASTLDHVRIHSELLSRYPSQLSGGELQRLAIARAILVKPRFLVLDEVTSMLDVSVQASIIRMLQELFGQHQMGCLCVTHNLALAQVFCHRVLRLEQGALVPLGASPEDFSAQVDGHRHPVEGPTGGQGCGRMPTSA
jgi:ABC-type dipeptide/oligopeptide/nickel transport system ATPase subunit